MGWLKSLPLRLVDVSYRWPKWQAVKLTFFAPWPIILFKFFNFHIPFWSLKLSTGKQQGQRSKS